MTVPFPDLDPYATLKVNKDADESTIKKSYRRLCLVHHPDKLVNKSSTHQKESETLFNKVQFAYHILSDSKRRARFDRTGSLEEQDAVGLEDFDWDDYFKASKVEITEEAIIKDKRIYQGSDDEKNDVIDALKSNNFNFLHLFETIPHIEVTDEDEDRLYQLVLRLVEDGDIESNDHWKKYLKNRKKLFNKYKKSIKDESKEAEELKEQILQKEERIDTEDELRKVIQKRQAGRLDDLINSLESKYTGKTAGKKKAKPSKKRKQEYEIDDEEFERIQKGLKKK